MGQKGEAETGRSWAMEATWGRVVEEGTWHRDGT